MRTRKLLIAVAALAVLGQSVAGQGPQAPATSDLPKVEFTKFTLPNGLDVIFHVDRKLPIVHINQWFHVGSKDERPGRTGFAHLFEHMMFQGSKNASDDYFIYVERAGANLAEGGVNGTTSHDRTNYFVTVPSGNLETMLWLESDRLATLLEATTQEKLDNQRDVVKNERRQGLENQPYGRWFPLMYGAIFPAGHPYSWPVIGSQEDLSAATLDDVKEFFRRYYTPNNLSLVIAGDFDPAEAKQLVEKYFGDLPPGPPLDRPARAVVSMSEERVIEVKDRVSLERVYIGWPTPEYFAPDEAALDIAARILSEGLSSRLNRALVYERQLATQVSAFNITGEIASVFVVMATARPGQSLAEIERVITDEIARLAKEGPTVEELERAKTKHESEFISGLERIGGFGGKADVLNQYNVFLGDPGMLEEDIGRYRALTTTAVQQAVARWLDTRNRAIVRFHPEHAQRPANALTLDRSKMPPLGEDRPFTAPAVQSAKLPNGLEVLVVERRDLPKVNVALVTRAGAAADPAGKAGLASLTVTTIDMGTKTRKALEIEETFGTLGTTLTGSVGRESARLGIDVLKRNLPPALALLADVVQNPTFPQDEVAREQKRTLDAIAQADRNPNALAARIVPMLAFGGEHPYGWPTQGLRGTVERITRDDIAAFHAARWKPGSTALIFAGDISLDEATALAREHFGGWSGGAAPAIQVPAPKPVPPGRVYLVDRPDSAQTVVAQILPGIRRTAPDYYALSVVDEAWGGSTLGTRLNMNLRETKGYSYGVFATLNAMSHTGGWWAMGGVQTDKTAEAVAEFDRELRDLAAARPISAEEFETVQARITRGYAQQFESLARVTQQIGNLWTLGLPMTELQREYDAVKTLTLDKVLAASKQYVRPDSVSYLLVGDRAKIEAGVRALNLGEIVVLDVEGRPVGGGTR
ncbi:MAG TPA: pitrilysin family protein [Vicinamibacterales bacterium]